MLSLYSQPYSADGGVDARSVTNAIGRTHLSLFELLLRETLQNSWDAKMGDHITFTIDEKTLTERETSILVESIFGDLPPKGKCTSLRRRKVEPLRVLMICDSGTKGLGGPVRADIAANGRPTDFVDFVRNIGRGESKGYKGGTYGLGKGVLFNASKLGICLVYSQTLENGKIEPRLIGLSGADPDYEFRKRRYTGRHWWGIPGADGIADPMTGAKARSLAQDAGMRLPAPGQTGTTIMIIEPNASDSSDGLTCMTDLRTAALKWAWPLVIPNHSGFPSVQFEFYLDGSQLSEIDPMKSYPYMNFARSYLDSEEFIDYPEAKTSWKVNRQSILQKNPRRVLGALSMRRPSGGQAEGHELDNTIALMRNPRIVVKYLEVPTHPSGEASHGVFVAQSDADYFFAQSEPVAHDDWVSEDVKELDGKRTNPVKVALREISDALKQYSANPISPSSSDDANGLSAVSAKLGGLLAGFTGTGAESVASPSPRSSSKSSVKTRRKATVVAVRGPVLGLRDGRVIVTREFEILGGSEGDTAFLEAKAHIINESGGVEGTSDEGSNAPSFVDWNVGGAVTSTKTIRINLPAESSYTVTFTQPQDTAVSINAQLGGLNDE